jgi:hypothetical protein
MGSMPTWAKIVAIVFFFSAQVRLGSRSRMVTIGMYQCKGIPGVELSVGMWRDVRVAGMGLVLATCTQVQESMLTTVQNPVAVRVTMLGFQNAAAGRGQGVSFGCILGVAGKRSVHSILLSKMQVSKFSY